MKEAVFHNAHTGALLASVPMALDAAACRPFDKARPIPAGSQVRIAVGEAV